MRLRMDSATGLLALALALDPAGNAARATERSARLDIGVTVLPSQPAARALANLPVPPGSRVQARTLSGGSFRYEGTATQAMRFYRAAMEAQGYRLASHQLQADGARQTWQRAGERVELDIRDAIGGRAARIVVSAIAMQETMPEKRDAGVSGGSSR